MIDDLRALAVFAKTVESGSFRGAAKDLSLSPSVVSHHISRLEERLGVALIYRSTRSLSLSADGQRLFASAKVMLDAAEQGLNAVSDRSLEPTGKLSITLPAVLVRSPLIRQLAMFHLQYPKISIDMDFSDRRRDLIKEGIDLAVRIGDLQSSGLKARKLFQLQRKLVASPELLSRFKQPANVHALSDWPWIGLPMRPDYKVLMNSDGEKHTVHFKPSVRADSVDAVTQLAVAGVGLATPSAYLAEPSLQSGELLELLPDWKVEPLDVYAIWPANAPRDGLTRLLLSFLTA